jgi:PIN domain nuclease of toxin-antitoxin system
LTRRSAATFAPDFALRASVGKGNRPKARIGKLEWPAAAGTINAYMLGQNFRALPISLEHAERAGQLRIANRDPFDRMFIAQAQAEDLWLVSNEKAFDSAGVRRLW